MTLPLSFVETALVADSNLDWRESLTRLEGAYSIHTLRGYRADIAMFVNWCAQERCVPFPAAPITIAAFIDQHAKHSAPATLRRRLASIRKIHHLMGLPSTAGDEDVVIALRRALRNKSRRSKQALGLTVQFRDRLILACPDTLIGLRNRAMIAVGYDILCRRSELVALKVENLETLPDGGQSVLVARSKNDPFGDGRKAYVSPEAARYLDVWIEASKVTTGWLFPGVRGHALASEPLHPFSVSRIIKTTAKAAGCTEDQVANFSGHSMRVGAAQDMMMAGLGHLPIMRAGGWKSMNIIARYVENIEALAIGELRKRHGC